MQFHGLRSETKSKCLWQELEQVAILRIKDNLIWIFLFAHVCEAVQYLHSGAHKFHLYTNVFSLMGFGAYWDGHSIASPGPILGQTIPLN